MAGAGRWLIIVGATIVLCGVVILVLDRIPGLRIGRLPGDIVIKRGDFRLYFPITTSILLSALLTLVFWLFGRRG